MAMTPEQLKELAEFGAEYLGFKVSHGATGGYFYCPAIMDDGHSYNTSVILEAPKFASYFMHLAQEKLENEGFDCEYNQQVGIHLWEFNMSLDYDRPVARAEHKNKFISFWSAVMQAKGGE